MGRPEHVSETSVYVQPALTHDPVNYISACILICYLLPLCGLAKLLKYTEKLKDGTWINMRILFDLAAT